MLRRLSHQRVDEAVRAPALRAGARRNARTTPPALVEPRQRASPARPPARRRSRRIARLGCCHRPRVRLRLPPPPPARRSSSCPATRPYRCSVRGSSAITSPMRAPGRAAASSSCSRWCPASAPRSVPPPLPRGAGAAPPPTPAASSRRSRVSRSASPRRQLRRPAQCHLLRRAARGEQGSLHHRSRQAVERSDHQGPERVAPARDGRVLERPVLHGRHGLDERRRVQRPAHRAEGPSPKATSTGSATTRSASRTADVAFRRRGRQRRAPPRFLCVSCSETLALAAGADPCDAPSVFAWRGRISAGASDLPPWRDADDLPSARGDAQRRRAARRAGDSQRAEAMRRRRGTAQLGVRLPFFAAKRGSGCAARWINIGPEAWICQDARQLRHRRARRFRRPSSKMLPSGLPFRYYFVGREGSNGYCRLEDAEDVAPDLELEPASRLRSWTRSEGQPPATFAPITGSGFRCAISGRWSRSLPRRRGKKRSSISRWVVEDKAFVLSAPGASPRTGKGGASGEVRQGRHPRGAHRKKVGYYPHR